MKGIVDQNLCIGCGMCTAIAPDAFRMNDENLAEGYGDDLEENIEAAVQGCPVGAISKDE